MKKDEFKFPEKIPSIRKRHKAILIQEENINLCDYLFFGLDLLSDMYRDEDLLKRQQRSRTNF